MENSRINYKVFNRTNLGLKKPSNVISRSVMLSDDRSENNMLLEQARVYWESLHDFRKRARRNRRYYRGDQWSDMVQDPDTGKYMSEGEYIKLQGKVPLKQNIIRQLTRNMVGQYRSGESKTLAVARSGDNRTYADMVSAAIDCAESINMANELDARAFETSLLSGAAFQKVGFGYIKERDIEDIVIHNRNINRMFYNTDVSDPRLYDLRMIGEIIDAPLPSVISSFARSKKDEERIREIYRNTPTFDPSLRDGLSADEVDRLSFLSPVENGKVRLYEIWYLKLVWKLYVHDEASGRRYMTDEGAKALEAINMERVQQAAEDGIPEDEVPMLRYEERSEEVWHVKFLSPDGYCLYEGETQFEHGEHPYVAFLYPLIDGEVWGFVEDIIDQQRYINRTIILLDFIISASAKGVLMIHEDALGGQRPEDFAAQWVRFNGVIVYKGKPGTPIPQQISASSSSAGIKELVQMQMMLIQDISGVHSAIQGKQAGGGTAASLYAQEAQNATLNTADYMQSFYSFKERRNRKMMKTILQYYDEPRHLAVSGFSGMAHKIYDPDRVRNGEYDLVTSQAPNTPTYKALIDDRLFELVKGNLINIEMYLQHSSMPFAEQLLEDIKGQREQMEQGQLPQVNPDMLSKLQGEGDPKAQQMIQQAIGKAA